MCTCALSVPFQVMHFCQLYATKRCQLYDYGSTAANVAAYQQPTPPVISERYHALRGVPVHLVAGLHDGVIPPSNIQCHYEAMKAAGVDVSYREVSTCTTMTSVGDLGFKQ